MNKPNIVKNSKSKTVSSNRLKISEEKKKEFLKKILVENCNINYVFLLII